MGLRIPAIPATRPMLKRLDPTTFPSSIENWSFLASETDAANSGRLVPMARRVKPINSSGTPALLARFSAPKTRESEPAQRAAVATRIIKDDDKGELESPGSSRKEDSSTISRSLSAWRVTK